MPKILQYWTIILTIGAAYLYFLGWMYLYYYLHYYGIDISSIEIEMFFILMFSFAVLGNLLTDLLLWYLSQCFLVQIVIPLLSLFVLFIIFVVFPILVSTLSRHVLGKLGGSRVYLMRAGKFSAIVVGILGAFMFGHELARSEALSYAESLRFNLNRRVELIFPTSMLNELDMPQCMRKEFSMLYQDRPENRAKLVFAAKDKFFILIQPSNPSVDGPNYVAAARVIPLKYTDKMIMKYIVDESRRVNSTGSIK